MPKVSVKTGINREVSLSESKANFSRKYKLSFMLFIGGKNTRKTHFCCYCAYFSLCTYLFMILYNTPVKFTINLGSVNRAISLTKSFWTANLLTKLFLNQFDYYICRGKHLKIAVATKYLKKTWNVKWNL